MFDRILFGYATFIDCCQRGELKRTELDDLIAAWHSSISKRPLRECIGLTVEEYEQFALDSKFIDKIIGQLPPSLHDAQINVNLNVAEK